LIENPNVKDFNNVKRILLFYKQIFELNEIDNKK